MDSHPPIDRRGRKRSPITVPEYRRGKPAPNKGMKLPAEVLAPGEVKALLESFGTTTAGVRNRAMVTLMYRASLKMNQLISLERHQYDRPKGMLTVPASRYQPERTLSLDPPAKQAVDAWMDARKADRISLAAPMFCAVEGPSKGSRIHSAYVRGTLSKKAAELGIERRVSAEGLKRSGIEHRARSHSRLSGHMEQYLTDEDFQLRFPDAFEYWESALDQFVAHPTRHADRIGHDCRAAMAVFIDAAMAKHGLKATGGTVTKLRELIKHAGPSSDAIRGQLEALVAFWGATSDLAQRQEHEAQRENESLSAADSQRLIFYTMLVMLETGRLRS